MTQNSRPRCPRNIFFHLGTRGKEFPCKRNMQDLRHETRNISPLCICITTRRGIKMKCLSDVNTARLIYPRNALHFKCFNLISLKVVDSRSPVRGTKKSQNFSSKQRRPRIRKKTKTQFVSGKQNRKSHRKLTHWASL